ncbi:hypothetical protein D3C87_2005460 [compost metagenome]
MRSWFKVLSNALTRLERVVPIEAPLAWLDFVSPTTSFNVSFCVNASNESVVGPGTGRLRS